MTLNLAPHSLVVTLDFLLNLLSLSFIVCIEISYYEG